jgi:DNA mismatch endonuclease (patch repair protein)
MSRQPSKDTGPERALRKALFAAGLRYRVHYPISTKPRRHADLVFVRARVAVFIDGCYWHGCPTHGTWPKSNADYWRTKIEGNRERDLSTDELLRANDWLAVRIWEHEDPLEAAERVAAIVRARVSDVSISGGVGPRRR